MERYLKAVGVVCAGVALAHVGIYAQADDALKRKVEGFFRNNDRDGDGYLSREEFPFQRLFDRIDADKDGKITMEEDTTFRRNRSSGTRQRRRRMPQERRMPRDLPGAKVERDIVYTRVGERELALDIYLPEDAARPLPVIVWIHGGGWRGGSIGSGGQARGMVARGFAVVDIDYRLSGEALFPAQIEDCKAAIRWVRANAKKYGLDPDRIGAWGSSAGGHLVAFLGTSEGVKEFETEENGEYSSRVNAVCDWFGPTDFLQMDAHRMKGRSLVHDSPTSPESRLVGGPIQDEPYRSLCKKADPITYVDGDEPPFLIMHGDQDRAVPVHQSQLLYEALKKANVDVTYYVVEGAGHGLRDGKKDTPEQLFEMSAAFFEKHLGKRDEP